MRHKRTTKLKDRRFMKYITPEYPADYAWYYMPEFLTLEQEYKMYVMDCQSCPNAKIINLAYFHKSPRVRKKNRKRILRYLYKEAAKSPDWTN